jgi:hypothetical protein
MVSREFSGVARRSQVPKRMFSALSLTSLLTSGCLIPEPPEYGAPERTPIFIIEHTKDPNPRSLLTISTVADIGTQTFTFQAQSEDDGEDVVAALHANYKHRGSTHIIQNTYEPSTFDVEKTISLDMSVPDGRLQAPGCYAMTLMVLHESGWDERKKEPVGTPTDMASVTWLMALTDGTTMPSLSDCPNVDTSMGQ